ncbi:hypothetical protein F5Y04DRAFT_283560 [Hypomontagnella monticulosa]|nr:hypothetical protein F5Y04DRAFT_283560 [Hypomontagnella monticulosa]
MVNEKIEDFFQLCEARGLTGEEAAIIPAKKHRAHVVKETCGSPTNSSGLAACGPAPSVDPPGARPRRQHAAGDPVVRGRNLHAGLLRGPAALGRGGRRPGGRERRAGLASLTPRKPWWPTSIPSISFEFVTPIVFVEFLFPAERYYDHLVLPGEFEVSDVVLVEVFPVVVLFEPCSSQGLALVVGADDAIRRHEPCEACGTLSSPSPEVDDANGFRIVRAEERLYHTHKPQDPTYRVSKQSLAYSIQYNHCRARLLYFESQPEYQNAVGTLRLSTPTTPTTASGVLGLTPPVDDDASGVYSDAPMPTDTVINPESTPGSLTKGPGPIHRDLVINQLAEHAWDARFSPYDFDLDC